MHLTATGLCERCSARGQILLSPSTLTFTPENWNLTQSVAVSAVDDDTVESLPSDMTYEVSVRHTAESLDPKYDVRCEIPSLTDFICHY